MRLIKKIIKGLANLAKLVITSRTAADAIATKNGMISL
jgi:hypothetical protein